VGEGREEGGQGEGEVGGAERRQLEVVRGGVRV
jgi:hypothetical protein